jgi:hypothetical protein
MNVKEEILEQLENKFNCCLRELRNSSSYLFELWYGFEDEYSNDRKEACEYWTHEYFCRMYNIICTYLELLSLDNYLNEFKKMYTSKVVDFNQPIKFTTLPCENGDTYDELELLIEWERFLEPFNLFKQNIDKDKEELKKILEFLECTNEIIKYSKNEISKEEDINSVIREVAKFYYNDVLSFSEGYFVHSFKHYRPDIIIREIKTAIEYKLIKSDKDIGIKLDELLVDAKRYTENHHNKFCIAVLCLSQEVKKTKKEIKLDWTKMNFPDNWKLIVIPDVKIEK